MVDIIEQNLLGRISKERNLEMQKYGRMKIYNKISKLLQDNKRIAFSLINHALAIIDDNIDTTANINQLDKAKDILTRSFLNEEVIISLGWEKDVSKLGYILFKLDKDNFNYATDIFNEVINYWNIEENNLNRRGKILSSSELDKLNLEIGKSVGIQFLYLLCSELSKKIISQIATLYGFSIKLADNLSDLNEDLEKGYINISEENLIKYKLKLNSSRKELLPYIQEEFKRVEKYYLKSDEKLKEILEKYPNSEKGLLIFKDIAHSWFNQVSEIYNFNSNKRPNPDGRITSI